MSSLLPIVYYQEEKTDSLKIAELNKRERDRQYKTLLSTLQRLLMEAKNTKYDVKAMKSFYTLSTSTNFAKKVALIVKKIKKNIKGDLPSEIRFQTGSIASILINYENILAISNMILAVLEKVTLRSSREKSNNIFSLLPKGTVINQIPISHYIQEFSTIKILDFSLSFDDFNDKDFDTNKYCLLLFVEFLHALFPFALEAKFDLNIYSINQKFNEMNDPSTITESEILKIGRSFKNILIFNYIFTRNFNALNNIVRLSFKLYDSYLLEIHHLFSEEFFFDDNKNSNNKSLSQSMQSLRDNMNKSYSQMQNTQEDDGNDSGGDNDLKASINLNKEIYIPTYTGNFSYELNNNMMMMTNLLLHDKIRKLSLDFNALDPLLFSNIIYLLMQNTSVNELSLDFFPKDDDINMRKILLNGNYYHYYENCQTVALQDEYEANDTCLDLANIVYNTKEFKPRSYIKYDKIPKKLFTYFNKNMTNLLIVLEQKLKQIFSLRISLCGKEDLEQYDNYQFSIHLFLLGVFRLLQNYISELKTGESTQSSKEKETKNTPAQTTLNQLEIELNYTNQQYMNNIFKRNHCNKNNDFDLSDLPLYQLKFAINDITQVLPFNKFPSKQLATLILQRLSINDFEELLLNLKSNRALFPKLSELHLNFDYCENLPFISLSQFLLKYIPSTLSRLIVSIPNQITIENMIRLMKCFSFNTTKLNKFLKLQLEFAVDNGEIEQPTFRTIFGETLKILFKKNNFYFGNLTFPSLSSFVCDIKMIDTTIIHKTCLPMIYCLTKKAKKKVSESILMTICCMLKVVKRKMTISFKQ